jgi:hypothetical protein
MWWASGISISFPTSRLLIPVLEFLRARVNQPVRLQGRRNPCKSSPFLMNGSEDKTPVPVEAHHWLTPSGPYGQNGANRITFGQLEGFGSS